MISTGDVHPRFVPPDAHILRVRARPSLFIEGGQGSHQAPPLMNYAHLSGDRPGPTPEEPRPPSGDRAWYARFWSLPRGGGLRPNLPPVPRPRGDWFRDGGPGFRLACSPGITCPAREPAGACKAAAAAQSARFASSLKVP